MILPDDNLREWRRGRPKTRGRMLLWTAGALVIAGVVWVAWVDGQIRAYAGHDEARPANAIAVFGAAEYDGRPSPVLRARLDHALELYQQGIAPMIITLGGGYEADAPHSEGGVGENYLLAHGVPEAAIIAETQSDNTEQSAERLAAIARENNLKSIVVVSDGTHLFRIHSICEHDGLQVYTSPRPEGRSISALERFERLAHEIASYTAWRMGLH
jgi:uncharacterized SAM-binding protein YcdF (DUF218 family)